MIAEAVAVVGPTGRTVGIARCVAVESAGDARACVNRRRVAGELPGGRGQYRGSGGDSAALDREPSRLPLILAALGPAWFWLSPAPAVRADGSDRARPAR